MPIQSVLFMSIKNNDECTFLQVSGIEMLNIGEALFTHVRDMRKKNIYNKEVFIDAKLK